LSKPFPFERLALASLRANGKAVRAEEANVRRLEARTPTVRAEEANMCRLEA
jgi:hypothetical protein